MMIFYEMTFPDEENVFVEYLKNISEKNTFKYCPRLYFAQLFDGYAMSADH